MSTLKTETTANEQPARPLEKMNFILLGVSVVLIVLGFILTGGEPSTEEAFNPDIFSTLRISVGPGMAFVGYVFLFFAILYKKKSRR